MDTVARGKALVAKLRAQPGVHNPEALAAYLGRVKRARKAGKSLAEAKVVARGRGSGDADKGRRMAKARREPDREPDVSPEEARRKRLAAAADLIGDPFNEDFGGNEPESKEDRQRRREEEGLLREMEKADRAALNTAIMDAGGIQTRADLTEEYRAIPNTYKRKDGLPGDEMAEYLGTYFPELGIETENDLLDYFSERYGVAA